MTGSIRKYNRETWTCIREPWGLFIKAKAVCPDGRARVVKLVQTADTFFSIPARLSYRNKTVCGFVSFESNDGLSSNPEQWVKFTPTGKHKNIFQEAT